MGHAEIAATMRTGDPERVRAAAAQHVNDAGKLLIGYFSKTGYWQEPTTTKTVRR